MEGREYHVNVNGWIMKITVPTYSDAYVEIGNFLTTAFKLAQEANERMGLEEMANAYDRALHDVEEGTWLITDELEDEINNAMEEIFDE